MRRLLQCLCILPFHVWHASFQTFYQLYIWFTNAQLFVIHSILGENPDKRNLKRRMQVYLVLECFLRPHVTKKLMLGNDEFYNYFISINSYGRFISSVSKQGEGSKMSKLEIHIKEHIKKWWKGQLKDCYNLNNLHVECREAKDNSRKFSKFELALDSFVGEELEVLFDAFWSHRGPCCLQRTFQVSLKQQAMLESETCCYFNWRSPHKKRRCCKSWRLNTFSHLTN